MVKLTESEKKAIQQSTSYSERRSIVLKAKEREAKEEEAKAKAQKWKEEVYEPVKKAKTQEEKKAIIEGYKYEQAKEKAIKEAYETGKPVYIKETGLLVDPKSKTPITWTKQPEKIVKQRWAQQYLLDYTPPTTKSRTTTEKEWTPPKAPVVSAYDPKAFKGERYATKKEFEKKAYEEWYKEKYPIRSKFFIPGERIIEKFETKTEEIPYLFPYTSVLGGGVRAVFDVSKSILHPKMTYETIKTTGKQFISEPTETIHKIGSGFGEQLETKGLGYSVGLIGGYVLTWKGLGKLTTKLTQPVLNKFVRGRGIQKGQPEIYRYTDLKTGKTTEYAGVSGEAKFWVQLGKKKFSPKYYDIGASSQKIIIQGKPTYSWSSVVYVKEEGGALSSYYAGGSGLFETTQLLKDVDIYKTTYTYSVLGKETGILQQFGKYGFGKSGIKTLEFKPLKVYSKSQYGGLWTETHSPKFEVIKGSLIKTEDYLIEAKTGYVTATNQFQIKDMSMTERGFSGIDYLGFKKGQIIKEFGSGEYISLGKQTPSPKEVYVWYNLDKKTLDILPSKKGAVSLKPFFKFDFTKPQTEIPLGIKPMTTDLFQEALKTTRTQYVSGITPDISFIPIPKSKEKLEIKTKPFDIVKPKPVETFKPEFNFTPIYKTIQKPVLKTIQKPITKPEYKPITKPKHKPITKTEPVIKPVFKVTPIQKAIQKQIVKSIQKSITTTPSPYTPYIAPTMPLYSPFLLPKKIERITQPTFPAFKVEIKRFGEWKTIAKGLPKREAISFGARRVSKTLGATFRIRATGGEATLKGILKFAQFEKQFRGYKKRKGQKIGMKKTFIEKRPFRLSTLTETKEIQFFKKKKGKGFF